MRLALYPDMGRVPSTSLSIPLSCPLNLRQTWPIGFHTILHKPSSLNCVYHQAFPQPAQVHTHTHAHTHMRTHAHSPPHAHTHRLLMDSQALKHVDSHTHWGAPRPRSSSWCSVPSSYSSTLWLLPTSLAWITPTRPSGAQTHPSTSQWDPGSLPLFQMCAAP